MTSESLPFEEVISRTRKSQSYATKSLEGGLMSNNNMNRVLGRTGARELTADEVEIVTGGKDHGQRTMTMCTITSNGTLDGDAYMGEC